MPDADFSLDDLVDAYSEPFPCPSAQAMLWVSRAVRRRATVLLTGDGGDDIFLGYPDFLNAWRAQRLARRLPAFAPAAWRAVRSVLPDSGAWRRLKNFLNYATGGLGEYLRAHDGIPYYERRSMLGERLEGRLVPQRRVPPSLESARHLLSGALAHHHAVHFPSEFMTKVDGATMYYSIEARAPLLDHKIWEYAAGLPPEVRFHGGRLKAVLREIARRRIGPEVAFRKKQGFTVPVERWLAERWSGMLDSLREGTLLEKEGWIRGGALQAPLREAIRRRWIPLQLWRLLVLEHWLENRS
jgi:asparagine synthase (glutamine-hydrolysing)